MKDIIISIIVVALITLVITLYIVFSLGTNSNTEEPVKGTNYRLESLIIKRETPAIIQVISGSKTFDIFHKDTKIFMDIEMQTSEYVQSKDKTNHALILTEEDYKRYNKMYINELGREMIYIEYSERESRK